MQRNVFLRNVGMVIHFAPNKNNQKVVKQGVWRDHKCQDFFYHMESFSSLHDSTEP